MNPEQNLDFEFQFETRECPDCGYDFVCKFPVIDGRPFCKPPRCQDCQKKLDDADSERKRAQDAEGKARAALQREKQWIALCPDEFRLAAEGGPTDTSRMDRERPWWRGVMEWRRGPRGLFLLGPSGTCKSRAMWRLIRREFEAGRSVAAFTPAKFDRECRSAGGDFTLTAWFDSIANADILFIDDIGKAAWTDATEAQFFDLVDHRTSWHKPIFVTSNDGGESLKERVRVQTRAEPLIRRIREYCNVIVFKAKSNP